MSSKYKFETRDERIERTMRANPGRPIELCAAVADGIWDKRRELVLSKIPQRFKDASIQDLGYMARPILDAVDDLFAPAGSNDKVGLILTGVPGSGKTHAAFAVLNKIAQDNPEMIAYMAQYTNAIQALRHEFSASTYDELGSVWDKLNNESGTYPGILFLDDVSSAKPTDFETDKFSIIIDHRINEYMPFMLTTNVRPEEFVDVYGERLASRFLGYAEIIEFEERDKRVGL